MRKTQMEAFRKILQEQKKKLFEKVKNNVMNSKDENVDDVKDAADMAADYYDREVAMGLSETERNRLQEVEDALERIENGTYGKCEMCDGLIAAPRLEALPFAKLCISCQAKEEQNRKSAV